MKGLGEAGSCDIVTLSCETRDGREIQCSLDKTKVMLITIGRNSKSRRKGGLIFNTASFVKKAQLLNSHRLYFPTQKMFIQLQMYLECILFYSPSFKIPFFYYSFFFC